MAKKQDLYVYMNGIHVGLLQHEAGGNLVFAYDTDWLALENARPISLSMPLTETSYKGYIVNSFFDNLLPDSEMIRKRIQARFKIPTDNCFDFLTNIGADCIGALQILTEPNLKNIKIINANPIKASEIAALLKNYQTAPLGMDRELDFRISIAGAQEKTALLWHKNKWHLPHGTTPTTHIIKLPIGIIKHSGLDLSNSVENEWLCLKILSAYHLPVNKTHIEQFDDMKTLVVERFDRRWSEDKTWLIRLPQEDFCQVLGVPSTLKYEADGGPGIKPIMDILLSAKDPITDRERFMKTVFLFWVLGAIDGHAKNFSLFIGPKGSYELTPIYDVLSAYPLIVQEQMQHRRLKMAMALKSKNRHYLWTTIQKRHWLAMADFCKSSSSLMQIIMDDVMDNMEEVINKVTNELPKNFPQAIAKDIFFGMRSTKHHFKK